MKTKSKISGYIIRSAVYAVFLSVVFIAFSSAFNSPNSWHKSAASATAAYDTTAKTLSQPRAISFTERVAFQRAIEEVYWRHRIWPKENPEPKPSLDAVMSQAQIEKKVEDYLRDSQLLADYWRQPITPEQLQAEMDRMAQRTKQPEVLRELFEALGNDTFVIAECLVRPALAERLVTTLYGHDQRFHGDLKRRAEAELAAHHSVSQMKQTSGTYSEVELVRNDSGLDEDNRGAEATVKLNSREWDQNVQKLAAIFGDDNATAAEPALSISRTGVSPAKHEKVAAIDLNRLGGSGEPPLPPKGAPITEIKTGVLSSLQEDEGHYYATAVMSKAKGRLRLATIAWMKQPFDSWQAKAQTQVPGTMAAVSANYTLPVISGQSDNWSPSVACSDDTWTATSAPPAARTYHTAVWTGTEMIVWGGYFSYNHYLNTGGRYNPITDSWTATSTTNAPTNREGHTAVWTGSQMIIWGGYFNDGSGHYLNTGGRYNPSINSWAATTTTGAPAAREWHTAVWTGSQMIVWGGYFHDGGDHYLNTGGRYNPSNNSWTATPTTGAPAARKYHTAVWTGSEMIVWGGYNTLYLNTGGRYKLSNNSWTATTTTSAPDGREDHTAVWTGSEMIVWGGANSSRYFNTGGRYDPSNNSWTATSISAPDGRENHTAVWTGSRMIVWGGSNSDSDFNTGGRYNPITNSWAAMATTRAPEARDSHTAVWTGTEMIVWGGEDSDSEFNTGGRYNPGTNSWTATSAPDARDSHTAVWTGTEMIVWGGYDGSFLNTGSRYNPSTNSWTATTTTGAPAARRDHTAVWTGSRMIVWGGYDGTYLNTGGLYNPSTNSWIATTTSGAPTGREYHTAVWTGSRMIVWGGEDGNYNPSLNTGGRYDPNTNSWTATTTTGAPAARYNHTAVWTGSQMIVWGGESYVTGIVNTGGRYNPSTNSWTATTTTGAPSARYIHTAVWTGSQMIVWGGYDGSDYLNTGGLYNFSTDSWTATSTTGAPTARNNHTAVWTGSQMIVWGGYNNGGYLNTGGRYNPSTNSWTATSLTNAPAARESHSAVWTGSQMIVWGGEDSDSEFNTGGRYCVQWVTTNPATNIASVSATLNGTVNPHGLATIVHFQYGTTTSYDFNTAYQNLSGNTYQNVAANIGGLTASTTYHFRIVGSNSSGTVYGADRTFTTLSATGAPVVTTNPATNIAGHSATLNGTVNPHGLNTTVYFQYGTTTSYGNRTVSQTKTGNTYQNVAANISSLTVSTTYHFRIVASNTAGTSYGADRTFTTASAPVVTTNPATNIASSSATLNGTVNPHGLNTTVYFQYGTTTSYGNRTASQTKTGNTYQNVAANISSLTASTTYHFRIVASNTAGTRYGADRTFTTTGPPGVTTNPATNIASVSATLNGTVNPHGLNTTVYFQYGTTTGYGNRTASQTKTGNTYQNVAANISGLTASTTYHFRIVASNTAGTRYGADRTFTTTGPPGVTTNPATLIASFSATLNGTVNPHGLNTTVHFQYGTTTSYGNRTASTVTGNTYQNVAANISGLSASTTYHFRIVASNSAGTRYGADRTFTTLSATGPPVVTTNPATLIASFSAKLNGTVNPHGLDTNVYVQYGTTTSYGTTLGPATATGDEYLDFYANIGPLSANTTYHFRWFASNSAGTSYGADRTFTTLSATGPPVVITNPATNVASSSATLNGAVDPHGLSTIVHGEYGTTTSYGSPTETDTVTGNTYIDVYYDISGLSVSTTYHFRIVATNSAGITYGSDRTFRTPP